MSSDPSDLSPTDARLARVRARLVATVAVVFGCSRPAVSPPVAAPPAEAPPGVARDASAPAAPDVAPPDAGVDVPDAPADARDAGRPRDSGRQPASRRRGVDPSLIIVY